MLKTLRYGRLAQLVEHCDHTAGVTGSSPVAPISFPDIISQSRYVASPVSL
jgi:hypothetical protein